MKKITLFILFMCSSLLISAQSYTTPNNGSNYDLDDIVNLSPSTLSYNGSEYTLSENLIISANDTFTISTPETLNIAADILITIQGKFTCDAGNNQIVIKAVNNSNPYEGFRFEQNSDVLINNTSITYGGGLKVITPNFTLTESFFSYNVSGAATGSVVSLSDGSPLIENNNFIFNDLPAISSGANQTVSATIKGNYLEGNGQLNQNRPQINMGATGVDTLRITNNIILGDASLDQVGGIAIANLLGGEVRAIIDDNTITDNRYGMTIAGGNAFAYIRNNVIENNNTQNLPNLGGSGISLNASTDTQTIIARNNKIRNNLWGITLLGEASINLGTDSSTDPGNNTFSENGNNGVTYALYNNTDNTIQAVFNCWEEDISFSTPSDVEPYIFHQDDDPTLGEVIFTPFDCANLNVTKNKALHVHIYPNPSTGNFSIDNIQNFQRLTIYDLNGKLIKTVSLKSNLNEIDSNLSSGIYHLAFENENQKTYKKLIIQ